MVLGAWIWTVISAMNWVHGLVILNKSNFLLKPINDHWKAEIHRYELGMYFPKLFVRLDFRKIEKQTMKMGGKSTNVTHIAKEGPLFMLITHALIWYHYYLFAQSPGNKGFTGRVTQIKLLKIPVAMNPNLDSINFPCITEPDPFIIMGLSVSLSSDMHDELCPISHLW